MRRRWLWLLSPFFFYGHFRICPSRFFGFVVGLRTRVTDDGQTCKKHNIFGGIHSVAFCVARGYYHIEDMAFEALKE
jgi:hypothetical protein